MKKILYLLLLLSLTSCGEIKETIACKVTLNGVSDESIYKSEKGVLTLSNHTLSYDFKEMKLSKEEKDALIETTQQLYNDLAGVTFTEIEKSDEQYTFNAIIDYQKTNINSLKRLQVLADSSQDPTKISMYRTTELLAGQGYLCQPVKE